MRPQSVHCRAAIATSQTADITQSRNGRGDSAVAPRDEAPRFAFSMPDPVAARAAGGPVEQEEGADEQGKDAVERVADRVGAAVDDEEDLGAEDEGHQRDDNSDAGSGKIEPADAFEPGHGRG